MSALTHLTPTPTPEWGAQPPTPNPKKKRPIMSVVGLVIGGLLVVGVVNSAMSNQPTTSRRPDQHPSPREGQEGLRASARGSAPRTRRRTSRWLAQRERVPPRGGVADHQPQLKATTVELSLLDASGTNVGWTNALVQALEPGQKARAPITDDSAVKVKVHEVQRTASS